MKRNDGVACIEMQQVRWSSKLRKELKKELKKERSKK